MEDRFVVGEIPGGALYAVFDGHAGAGVADHACTTVLESARKGFSSSASLEPWGSIFGDLDLDVAGCGSTATVVIYRFPRLSIAWVGDSRALLVRSSGHRALTRAHRADRADERDRVLSAGAELRGPYVLDPLTSRGLMITRSLGDRDLRRIGIISEPEIASFTLTPEDIGFVLATDGLWDVVPDEDVAALCRNTEAQRAADKLVDLVGRRRGEDNVTVVVIRFPARRPIR
jgi:protein phosphatase 1L